MEQLTDIKFDSARFWVKAYNVPAKQQTHAFARFLASKVGTLVTCDEEIMYGVDKALCFRADIAIDRPLKGGQNVVLESRSMWIDLRFVKLPDFCYVCGMLRHVTKGCALYNPNLSDSELQYGDWLRASPMKSRRRGVEAKITEERKLYIAFRSEQQVPRARLQLTFDKDSLKSTAIMSQETTT